MFCARCTNAYRCAMRVSSRKPWPIVLILVRIMGCVTRCRWDPRRERGASSTRDQRVGSPAVQSFADYAGWHRGSVRGASTAEHTVTNLLALRTHGGQETRWHVCGQDTTGEISRGSSPAPSHRPGRVERMCGASLHPRQCRGVHASPERLLAIVRGHRSRESSSHDVCAG